MSPSIWQILIVLGIALLFFGPKRLPGLGKSLGEAIRGFKKGINEDAIDVTDSVKDPEQIRRGEDSSVHSKESERKKETT